MLTSLLVVLIILLVVPFFLGYLHAGLSKKVASTLICYRYFMTFNMVFSGAFVAGRLYFDAPHAAMTSHWPYSPIFHMYAGAVFSMVLMGALTVYARTQLCMAAGLLWLIFLLTSTFLYLKQFALHTVANPGTIWLHVGYNLIVSVVLLWFLLLLRSYFNLEK